MVILGQHNIQPYLEGRLKKIRAFNGSHITDIIEVTDYSNANFIFKITVQTASDRRSLFLKQAQRYNKRALRQGQKISIHPNRIVGEHQLLRLLQQLWGAQHVPEIIFFDRANHVLLLTDVGQGKKLLINEFAAGRLYPHLGKQFGLLFGRLHGTTHGKRWEYAGSQKWKNQLFRSLIHGYWGTGVKRHFKPAVVTTFLRQVQVAQPSVIWGDPVYRNIFVNQKNFTCVDFDHTHAFDPAFDNGVFLAHWIWMMAKGNQRLTKDAEKFIRQYLKAYQSTLIDQGVSTDHVATIMNRTLRWAGYYLISRTDGYSGSYFKQWPAWEKRVRQLGIDLFGEQYRTATSRRLASLFIS